jgi:hypothetical protein
MEELRTAARETLQRRDFSILPEARLDSINVPEDLDLLWHNVSSHQANDTATVRKSPEVPGCSSTDDVEVDLRESPHRPSISDTPELKELIGK